LTLDGDCGMLKYEAFLVGSIGVGDNYSGTVDSICGKFGIGGKKVAVGEYQIWTGTGELGQTSRAFDPRVGDYQRSSGCFPKPGRR